MAHTHKHACARTQKRIEKVSSLPLFFSHAVFASPLHYVVKLWQKQIFYKNLNGFQKWSQHL